MRKSKQLLSCEKVSIYVFNNEVSEIIISGQNTSTFSVVDLSLDQLLWAGFESAHQTGRRFLLRPLPFS